MPEFIVQSGVSAATPLIAALPLRWTKAETHGAVHCLAHPKPIPLRKTDAILAKSSSFGLKVAWLVCASSWVPCLV